MVVVVSNSGCLLLFCQLPDFAALTCLTSLDLSRNQLESLPMELLQLPQLRTLKLSGNRIAELPDSIEVLQGLAELDVSKNILATFSPALLNLKLQTLNISSNLITVLPEKIGYVGAASIAQP